MNESSKGVFKSRTVNGVNIGIDIKYQYSSAISTKDLKAGANILNFVNEDTRSYVKGSHADILKNGLPELVCFTGRTGVIGINKWNSNQTIFHETLHFTGLTNRYFEHGARDNELNPVPGFQNDIMGSRSFKIGYDHYNAYLNWANDPTRGTWKSFLNRGVVDNNTSASKKQIAEQ